MNARRFLATAVLVLAAAGTFTACSSGTPEAGAMCQALDSGAVPGVALMQAYKPTDEAGAMDAMRRGPKDIRETCPQHEAAAALFESITSFTGQAPLAPTPTSVAPVNAVPKSYTLRVSGTVKPQQVTWSFDGSSGGGETVPFEKVVTAQADTNNGGTVGAVSGDGAGTLTCSVIDNATGQTVDTKTAESDGSEYSYASVMCAIPTEMGAAYTPGYSAANGEVNPGGNGG